ncbi:Transposon Tn7 transposition protein TnsB [Pandoraea pneumonica]|uniref:Transposon Tn7 transposition protein TnsB n=1 Tax=Pandoraea pneumonica TaxID=2508299 RepID=A0A5E4VUK4_9BURK|nr:Transposon Tn7 transposition protein TnsB [Pandoraea pneumonica]
MHVGAKLESADRFQGRSATRYAHFLMSSERYKSVALVTFEKRAEPFAELLRLPRSDFETLVASGAIFETPDQPTLPPGLEDLEGRDIYLIERWREEKGRLRSNLKVMEQRRDVVDTLCEGDLEKLLFGSSDPIASIAKAVKERTHRKDTTRVRYWLLAYLTFGRRELALYPATIKNGRWDRSSLPSDARLGRPPLEDPLPQLRISAELAEKMVKSYSSRVIDGHTSSTAYTSFVRKHFGVTVKSRPIGDMLCQPEGLPFPSKRQYDYAIHKLLKRSEIDELRLGKHRYNNTLSPREGAFSEGVGNVFQAVQLDAAQAPELPIGFLGEIQQLPLQVVRMIDVASGIGLGIGFSLGAERASAYRMAHFCCSISKVKFARLLGLEIDENDWPCVGTPGGAVYDRGPGATIEHADATSTVEMTPSYAPKGKPNVEGSHPKKRARQGPPQVRISNLNPIEMVKREILRQIKDNKSSDAFSRMTPEMIRSEVLPIPNDIYAWLDGRGRSSAGRISFDEAVREWLDPVIFTVSRNGLSYRSAEYRDMGILLRNFREKLPRHCTFNIPGFVLPFCVRYAWIEISGHLVEVERVLPLTDDPTLLFESLQDLEREEVTARMLARRGRKAAAAAELEYQSKHESQIGLSPHDSNSIPRRAVKKRNKQKERALRDTVHS